MAVKQLLDKLRSEGFVLLDPAWNVVRTNGIPTGYTHVNVRHPASIGVNDSLFREKVELLILLNL